jgi:hypothetical protein
VCKKEDLCVQIRFLCRFHRGWTGTCSRMLWIILVQCTSHVGRHIDTHPYSLKLRDIEESWQILRKTKSTPKVSWKKMDPCYFKIPKHWNPGPAHQCVGLILKILTYLLRNLHIPQNCCNAKKLSSRDLNQENVSMLEIYLFASTPTLRSSKPSQY